MAANPTYAMQNLIKEIEQANLAEGNNTVPEVLEPITKACTEYILSCKAEKSSQLEKLEGLDIQNKAHFEEKLKALKEIYKRNNRPRDVKESFKDLYKVLKDARDINEYRTIHNRFKESIMSQVITTKQLDAMCDRLLNNVEQDTNILELMNPEIRKLVNNFIKRVRKILLNKKLTNRAKIDALYPLYEKTKPELKRLAENFLYGYNFSIEDVVIDDDSEQTLGQFLREKYEQEHRKAWVEHGNHVEIVVDGEIELEAPPLDQESSEYIKGRLIDSYLKMCMFWITDKLNTYLKFGDESANELRLGLSLLAESSIHYDLDFIKSKFTLEEDYPQKAARNRAQSKFHNFFRSVPLPSLSSQSREQDEQLYTGKAEEKLKSAPVTDAHSLPVSQAEKMPLSTSKELLDFPPGLLPPGLSFKPKSRAIFSSAPNEAGGKGKEEENLSPNSDNSAGFFGGKRAAKKSDDHSQESYAHSQKPDRPPL